MAEASEIGGYISTAAGLGMEFSGFAPGWVFLQTIIFVISAALAVFDTYTDWEVVFNFQETGLSNPLLPDNPQWVRAWFFFACVGTLLTAVSILHDGIDLLYAYYKSCQKHCCKSSKGHYDASDSIELKEKGSEKGENVKDPDSKDNKEEDEIPDPLKCCFRHGWNGTTRNETLGSLTLWFQDIPMLTLSVLLAVVTRSCKTPDGSDVSPILLDVGISATAAVAASCWRLLRSIARLGSSVGVRTDLKSRCLPTPSEAAYPPNTCAQYCMLPFCCGLVMQFVAISAGIAIVLVIWLFFGFARAGSDFNQLLAVYRSSDFDTNTALFNLTGTVIPPNGTFTYLERIPISLSSLSDTYCLSEFEYRSQDSLVFYNTIEVILVTDDGEFCVTRSGMSSSNGCNTYYSQEKLFFGYVDPNFNSLEQFHRACTMGAHVRPRIDPNLNVSNHINRAGFPMSNEQLVVDYPNFQNFSVLFSDIIAAGSAGLEFETVDNPVDNGIFYCGLRLRYSSLRHAVVYNYQGVFEGNGQCICQSKASCDPLFDQTAVYGFLREGYGVVPYTQCASIPNEYIKPQYETVYYCPCQ